MTRLFHVVTGYELVVTKDFSSYKKRCFHVMKYKLLRHNGELFML